MLRRSFFYPCVLALPFVGAACGSEGAGQRASSGAVCCVPSEAPASCMHLGGTNLGGDSCPAVCDFYCATNFRLTTNADGCAEWEFDHRAPAPDENTSCFKKL